MRNLRNPQLERGEVRIEDIELDIKSRNDILVLLIAGSSSICIRRRLCATVFLRSWTNISFPALTERRDVRAWRCGAFW